MVITPLAFCLYLLGAFALGCALGFFAGMLGGYAVGLQHGARATMLAVTTHGSNMIKAAQAASVARDVN